MQERLCELESLTRDYARYSRSAGGLASVLGGVFCLSSYLLGGLLPLTPLLRIGLVALPLVWLLARWSMVHRYYQRLGHVEEQEGTAEHRTHRLCVGVTLVVAALQTVSALMHGVQPSPGVTAYLALVWLLVLAGWRWLRSPLDFVVGVFLFCQAALLCVGRVYPVIGTSAALDALPMELLALLFPLAALLMVARGMADHRRFLQLRERLLRLRNAVAGES
ncbi:hypothetical protein ABQJ54_12435 [Rhodanobacter sp. Si-c]|uniref:GGDEF domain-containing protein n=1 Tax=Rhodanobacter lycopersici TaxID=3162487 RepID=A0ABV3QFF5_9GAMM